MIYSHISRLKCSGCGLEYSHKEIHTFCPDYQSPLLANYDLNRVRNQVDRDEISRRRRGMWRWHELLPVIDSKNIVFLGEGDTALLKVPNLGKELGLSNLYKARGLAAAVSKARGLGIKKVIIPTAGWHGSRRFNFQCG